ncbi:putative signaling protein [Zhongshania aliphaticivorans]|uniref:Putative signaling protein n=1 Tax=Zhongshania aliphaticivorans TaxID=1470434 RepID=A0A5S9PZV5_9GAMM|nr:GGDEF domain-containing protein [Zhongshania aliphaticivorans]CAA0110342.1 putative signaling protein [Zhongshania aliphaticivorans]CAA0118094.1 putative signaling protein [Zhongshania aliphaticivorans]
MTKFRRFNFLSLIDPLLSKAEGGEARLIRHRFVASLILSVMFYISVLAIVASFFLPLGEQGLNIVRAFFIVSGLGALLSIYILRALDRRVFAINTFIAFLGLAILYLALMTGGILSPASICLIIIPAVATLSIDSRAGVIWGGLACLFWTLLFVMPYIGVEMPQLMPEVDDHMAFYFCIITTHTFIAFVALYYESTSKALRLNLLKEKREYFYLANHDAHTGTINRRHFLEILEQEVARCESSDDSFCLFFIDLNDFKKANDEFGHDYGDQILEVFSRRLRHRVRAVDTVARIGGDEFCVISRDMKNEADAKRGEQRFDLILQEPLVLAEGSYTLKASIGWAIYPVDAKDSKTLLKFADQSMYEAKRRNKAATAL